MVDWPEDRWAQDILPQPGQVGGDLARRPCVRYLNQTPRNLDKPIFFVAIRFGHWDRYPEVYGTDPDDMSLAMYRTEQGRDDYIKALAGKGNRIIVGVLTPRRLIEVLGTPLNTKHLPAPTRPDHG